MHFQWFIGGQIEDSKPLGLIGDPPPTHKKKMKITPTAEEVVWTLIKNFVASYPISYSYLVAYFFAELVFPFGFQTFRLITRFMFKVFALLDDSS